MPLPARATETIALFVSGVDLDVEPGDRSADCGGMMEPLAIASRPDGEWTLVHKCRRCGVLSRNRIAGMMTHRPDGSRGAPAGATSLPADRAGPHAIGMAGPRREVR